MSKRIISSDYVNDFPKNYIKLPLTLTQSFIKIKPKQTVTIDVLNAAQILIQINKKHF